MNTRTVPIAGWLARIAVLVSMLLLGTGCVGPRWQTPISAETHRDVKNYVDFQIRSINELERRLERVDSKEKYIATLDFAGSAITAL